ncbi:MAG TPA: ABC transporter ATP-binding protein [Myxococcota bacterium]|nr:ABC transporter ATP-binding protein [Myxococcota bacterium]
MPILSLSDVGKRYPLGESYVDALNGVTLDIDEGEFLAFAGPSGSGKTTLLNLVGCLDVATSGSIVLDGKELSKLSRAELGDIRADNVGFVFQSFNLIPVLSAIENVEVALRLGGREPSRERCANVLEEVGLADQMHKRPSQMSGGQQQRVAIARALVKEPRLVIADEPTANLDSKNGEAVLDLMRELNEEQGATFLFSTHDPIVMDRVRRTVRLRDGKVIGDS